MWIKRLRKDAIYSTFYYLNMKKVVFSKIFQILNVAFGIRQIVLWWEDGEAFAFCMNK